VLEVNHARVRALRQIADLDRTSVQPADKFSRMVG
jgi:hypothetical protein